MKHTHRGHCQLCGRIHAAHIIGWEADGNPELTPITVLPKHGYKVANFGYFVGTCAGSGKLPLEKDRKELDSMLVQLADWATDQEVLANKYRGGQRKPETCQTDQRVRNPITHRWEPVYIDWAAATDTQRVDEVKRCIWTHEQNARGARSHIKDMTALGARVHGQPLMPAAAVVAPVELASGLTFTDQNRKRKLTLTGARRFKSYMCKDEAGHVWGYSAHEIRRWVRAAQ